VVLKHCKIQSSGTKVVLKNCKSAVHLQKVYAATGCSAFFSTTTLNFAVLLRCTQVYCKSPGVRSDWLQRLYRQRGQPPPGTHRHSLYLLYSYKTSACVYQRTRECLLCQHKSTVRSAANRLLARSGAHFTCFTSTEVHILPAQKHCQKRGEPPPGTQWYSLYLLY
jgi:hypothetical protein